jgi:beta-glucuronidase
MARRSRKHDLRPGTTLDEVWDFVFLGVVDPDKVGVNAIRYDDRMAVPGCFDATPAYAGKRGLTAYPTRVLFHDDTPHRITFDGVSHWCRVYVNGRPLRDHVGSFNNQGTVDEYRRPKMAYDTVKQHLHSLH